MCQTLSRLGVKVRGGMPLGAVFLRPIHQDGVSAHGVRMVGAASLKPRLSPQQEYQEQAV